MTDMNGTWLRAGIVVFDMLWFYLHRLIVSADWKAWQSLHFQRQWIDKLRGKDTLEG